MTCTYLNNSRTRSAVQSPLSSPGWGQVDSDRLGYDGAGRMITKRWLGSQLNEQKGYDDTWPYCGFTAAYDHASNKLYERHLHAESRSHLYPDQDSLDRLREYQRGTLQQDSQTGAVSVATPISLPGTDQQRAYDLDGLGNWRRTAHTPVGGSQATEVRRHNSVNQLTRYGTTPVAYDHGNNAADPDPDVARRGSGNVTDDGVRLYKYDAFNRLIEVRRKSDSAVIGTYVYDALGRRIVKTVSNGGLPGNLPNVATVYLYAGSQCVEERDSAENAVRQYVWGRYIDELVQQKELVGQSPQTYWPMSDLLYRTIALGNPNGDGGIQEVYDYDAYGNTLIYDQPGAYMEWFLDNDHLADPQNPKSRFLFTGREYDAELSDATGQIYFYRARYYSPQMGRWLQRDPGGYVHQMDLYTYVLGNPSVEVDPFGLQDATVKPTSAPTSDPIWGRIAAWIEDERLETRRHPGRQFPAMPPTPTRRDLMATCHGGAGRESAQERIGSPKDVNVGWVLNRASDVSTGLEAVADIRGAPQASALMKIGARAFGAAGVIAETVEAPPGERSAALLWGTFNLGAAEASWSTVSAIAGPIPGAVAAIAAGAGADKFVKWVGNQVDEGSRALADWYVRQLFENARKADNNPPMSTPFPGLHTSGGLEWLDETEFMGGP